MMYQPPQGHQSSPETDQTQLQQNNLQPQPDFSQQQHPGYPPQNGYLQQPMPPQQLMPQREPKAWLWIIACIVCLLVGYAVGGSGKSTTTTTDATSVAQAT